VAWIYSLCRARARFDGLVHDRVGHHRQLEVLVLTEPAESVQSLGLGHTGAAHDDPDRTVHHATFADRDLQLIRQPLRLGQDVRVLDRDRCRDGEQRAQLGRAVVEGMLGAGRRRSSLPASRGR